MAVRRVRGFSLLELAVVACVLSILVAVYLNRLGIYQEAAERAQFESALQIYKTALQLRLAELILERREAEVSSLEVENPTAWLQRRPENYAGEYPAEPRPGNWYFDAATRDLVYVVNNGRDLSINDENGRKQLRYRAKVIFQPGSSAGAGPQAIGGIALIPRNAYQWR